VLSRTSGKFDDGLRIEFANELGAFLGVNVDASQCIDEIASWATAEYRLSLLNQALALAIWMEDGSIEEDVWGRLLHQSCGFG
jgi:hypothetical protein